MNHDDGSSWFGLVWCVCLCVCMHTSISCGSHVARTICELISMPNISFDAGKPSHGVDSESQRSNNSDDTSLCSSKQQRQHRIRGINREIWKKNVNFTFSFMWLFSVLCAVSQPPHILQCMLRRQSIRCHVHPHVEPRKRIRSEWRVHVVHDHDACCPLAAAPLRCRRNGNGNRMKTKCSPFDFDNRHAVGIHTVPNQPLSKCIQLHRLRELFHRCRTHHNDSHSHPM